MTAEVITIGLQKGGVGRTTTVGLLSYMLAKDGYKVLAVDMDSQGNHSSLLTQEEEDHFSVKNYFRSLFLR